VIDLPPPDAEPPRPAIVSPRPREVSYGRIVGRVGAGTTRLVIKVGDRTAADLDVQPGTFRTRIALPLRGVRITAIAFDVDGDASEPRRVAPVFGLPARARSSTIRSALDARLQRRVRELARGFPGTAAVYVQHLRTGRGAAWNARARFPAASTLKIAIAVETLRSLRRVPAPGTWLAARLRRMLVVSDNEAANDLLVWLGGSTTGGAARVNATLRAVGLVDSYMYGGYVIGTAATQPIPLTVVSQPAFGIGKYTTAWDMARLHRYVHLGTAGRGALVRRLAGFSRADARFLLFTLAHVRDPGKLDRYLPPGVALEHKAGWIRYARHDSGIVFYEGGAYVAVVMTWRSSGAGTSSDILAGRVAQAALRRFRHTAAEPAVQRLRYSL
jgi:beta-lactamase class A